jgi:hypothetical protein
MLTPAKLSTGGADASSCAASTDVEEKLGFLDMEMEIGDLHNKGAGAFRFASHDTDLS